MNKFTCTLFICLVALSGLLNAQGQQKKAEEPKHQHKEQSQKNQKSDVATSENLSGKEKARHAKKLLDEAKNELFYNCCITEPCDRCVLDHQSCSCNRDLREGKGVCSDCYAGWQRGLGKDIKGVTKESVRPNFHSHKR